MLPDLPDATYIARGKFSTLKGEKRVQLKRVQDICTTLVNAAYRAMEECQAKVQDQPQNIVILAKCVENLTEARDKVITLNAGMAELENEAWPK